MLKDSALYHDYAAVMSEAGPDRRVHWRAGLLLFALALLVRLALLPLATIATSDTAVRIWLGWLWAEDPSLITNGLWGPLHFYLIGTVLRFWGDPVWAPIALHIAIGSLLPVVACQLTLELFGSRRSALAAGLIFAFYPAAIIVNLGVLAETPFMVLLGLGLIALARARRPDGRMAHAVSAGVAVTLASMLRYEAWLLLPFLALLLVRRPKFAAAFLATAMIHPVFWMVGNAIAFGNPLHSLIATSTWQQDLMAVKPDTRVLPGLARIMKFVGRTAVEMTVPVALLAALGVIRSIRQKRIEAGWLLPPLALFLVFAVSLYRATMVIRSDYTATFGLFLIPYSALAFEWLGIERWSRARCLAGAAVLIGAMGFFMFKPLMSRLPGGSWLDATPVPSVPDEDSVRKLQSLIDRAGLQRRSDALVSDFFGEQSTTYLAWQTRLRPERICRATGLVNLNLSPEEVEVFLLSNRTGVLITRPGGPLTALLNSTADGNGTLAGIPLRLQPVGILNWDDRGSGHGFGVLTVSRYQVVGMDQVPPRAALPCTFSCPLALCPQPAGQ